MDGIRSEPIRSEVFWSIQWGGIMQFSQSGVNDIRSFVWFNLLFLLLYRLSE